MCGGGIAHLAEGCCTPDSAGCHGREDARDLGEKSPVPNEMNGRCGEAPHLAPSRTSAREHTRSGDARRRCREAERRRRCGGAERRR